MTIESERQTRERLFLALAAAEVLWLAEGYSFEGVQAPKEVLKGFPEALAFVRDGARWSILKRAEMADSEEFTTFSCQLSADVPNSGFVGRLASEFRRELGSGVFVVCGQISDRGGIFDYCGIPAEIGDQAKLFLASLAPRDR